MKKKESDNKSTLTLIESIYKLSLNLQNENVQLLPEIIKSIYKLSLNLQNENIQLLPEITESIYKFSLYLQNEKILSDYLKNLRRVLKSSVESQTEQECISYIEAFSSEGQLKSKLWLIQTLKELKLTELGRVFLCAGWCGSLAYLLLQDKSFKISKIFNFDIDPLSIQMSEDLNRKWVQENWQFKATLKNILDLDYNLADFKTLKKDGSNQRLQLSPDTIINTSCEHIKNFNNWWEKIPKEKLIILQSNNFHSLEEHINCVSSLEEFENQISMDLTLFKGELDLGEYKRFMLIGKK